MCLLQTVNSYTSPQRAAYHVRQHFTITTDMCTRPFVHHQNCVSFCDRRMYPYLPPIMSSLFTAASTGQFVNPCLCRLIFIFLKLYQYVQVHIIITNMLSVVMRQRLLCDRRMFPYIPAPACGTIPPFGTAGSSVSDVPVPEKISRPYQALSNERSSMHIEVVT